MADTDLTQAPLTHARVLRIALPIVLSNATVPIIGAVDTGVIGQMGSAAAIGAVGLGAVILATIYWVFGFLRMGTTGLTGQAIGAGDQAEMVAHLTRAVMIGLAAGALIIAVQAPLIWAAFRTAPASAEVEALARQYLSIRIWGAPATIAVFGLNGWLIARERTRAVFVIQVWITGVNAALDLWFVLGLGWGIPGVAVASLIAEVSGLGLALWFCRDALITPAWRDWARVTNRAMLGRMVAVNGNIALRTICLMAVFVSFLFLGAGFGDVTLAANHILLQFIDITAYALDGFAFAAEALVAQAVGARNIAALRRSIWLAAVWSGVGAMLLALTFAVLGGPLVDVMAKVPAVQAEVRAFLPYMVAVPLLGVAAWVLDGVFIGATRGADMRNMTALSAALYFASLPILLPAFGNHGLWIALVGSFVLRGITLGLRYPALERSLAAA